jgi:hypothetical protein
MLTCLRGHPLTCRGDRWCAHGLSGLSPQPSCCPVSPALPSVPWALVPHLPGSWAEPTHPRYAASRRLPVAPLAPLHVALAMHDLVCCRSLGAVTGSRTAGSHPCAPGLLGPRYPASAGNRDQETTGSPPCPSDPRDDLPRAQTPGVSWILAAHASRTPAVRRSPAVGFPRAAAAGLLADHDSTNVGALSRGLSPRSPELRTSMAG